MLSLFEFAMGFSYHKVTSDIPLRHLLCNCVLPQLLAKFQTQYFRDKLKEPLQNINETFSLNLKCIKKMTNERQKRLVLRKYHDHSTRMQTKFS